MKQTKKQVFLEKIGSLNGIDKEEVARRLGISESTLISYVSMLGAGCITYQEGKVIVDQRVWKEIIDIEAKDGNVIENHKIRNSYRNNADNEQFIQNGGLTKNGHPNPFLGVVEVFKELELMEREYEVEFKIELNNTERIISGERLG